MKNLLTFILVSFLSSSLFAVTPQEAHSISTALETAKFETAKPSRLTHAKINQKSLFFDPKFKIYYLHSGDKLYYSYQPKQSNWQQVQSVPVSFVDLPKTDEFSKIRESLQTFNEPKSQFRPTLPLDPNFYVSYYGPLSPAQKPFYQQGDLGELIPSFYAREFNIFRNTNFLYREWNNRYRQLERQRTPLFDSLNQRDYGRNNQINRDQRHLRDYYRNNLNRIPRSRSYSPSGSSYLPRR